MLTWISEDLDSPACGAPMPCAAGTSKLTGYLFVSKDSTLMSKTSGLTARGEVTVGTAMVQNPPFGWHWLSQI